MKRNSVLLLTALAACWAFKTTALAWPEDGSPVARFEQDNPSITYAGTWSTSLRPEYRGGSAVFSMEAGARATFSFTGATAVRWWGQRDPWSGIANVFLDGQLVATVDTSSSPGRFLLGSRRMELSPGDS